MVVVPNTKPLSTYGMAVKVPIFSKSPNKAGRPLENTWG